MLSQKRSLTLKWLARIHLGVLLFSFFLYLGIGFVLGPEFLYQDIRKKFFAFASDDIVVTAVVPGPPAVPIVSATAVCISGAPRVVLDWADDTGSTSFDIDRDSLPLTTGLTASGYTDTSVLSNTAYVYQVTAFGPMSPGTAVSGAIPVTTLDCANIAPVTVTIETLGGKSVVTDRSNVDITKFRPKISGTSNTPDAIIDIIVTNPTIRARILANSNGYFEWVPPIKLDTGRHLIEITATDPSDISRTATDTLIFKVVGNGESGDGRQSVGSSGQSIAENASGTDFLVTVNDSDQTLSQEDILSVTLSAKGGSFPGDSAVRIFLNNPEYQDALQFSEIPLLAGQKSVTLLERLPLYLEPGQYRVRADMATGGEVVSREDLFTLKPLPLFTLAGREISYIEAASYIGFFFFSLLFLFLFLLLFFVREYWLSLHRLRSITERHLGRLGFLSPRKGVVR